MLIMPYPYLYAFRNTYDIVSESSKIMKLRWVFSPAHISLTFATVGLCSIKGQQCVFQMGRKHVRCDTKT